MSKTYYDPKLGCTVTDETRDDLYGLFQRGVWVAIAIAIVIAVAVGAQTYHDSQPPPTDPGMCQASQAC